METGKWGLGTVCRSTSESRHGQEVGKEDHREPGQSECDNRRDRTTGVERSRRWVGT